MSKTFVTESFTTEFQNSAQSGTVRMISPAETNVKAQNQGVYAGTLSFSVSSFTGTTVVGETGKGGSTVTGTSIIKANSKNILLDGDKSEQVLISGTNAKGDYATETAVVVFHSTQSAVSGN